MKLIVIYNPNAGYLFSDGRAEEWVDETIGMFKIALLWDEDPEWRIVVSSALLVDYFRLRLAQGIIPVDQIEFVFNDEVLSHYKDGRIRPWPEGFCDKTDKILE